MVGYKRVSALDQTDLRQLDGLEGTKMSRTRRTAKLCHCYPLTLPLPDEVPLTLSNGPGGT